MLLERILFFLEVFYEDQDGSIPGSTRRKMLEVESLFQLDMETITKQVKRSYSDDFDVEVRRSLQELYEDDGYLFFCFVFNVNTR